MTEKEVAAGGSVASDHQRHELASLQDARRPHGQEAQHGEQEQRQAPQQLPAAQVWATLGRAGQKQLEHPAAAREHGEEMEGAGRGGARALCSPVLRDLTQLPVPRSCTAGKAQRWVGLGVQEWKTPLWRSGRPYL